MRSPAVLALILALGCESQPEPRERERPRHSERWEAVREESARLVPDALEGVALGMTRQEVRAVRTAMHRDERANEPGLVFESEDLPDRSRAVYAFDARTARLQRIQLLRTLPSAADIAPHLRTLDERYGPPTGVWDCPDTGGVPTRRFTWRRAHTTISDVFLLFGGRVSVTLYVAPTPVIERSLRLAACRPLESREALERFPVATPEQMGVLE